MSFAEQHETVASGAASVAAGRDITGPVVTNHQVNFWLTERGSDGPDPLSWPLAGEVDALVLGVHPARASDAGAALPPYVLRDSDRGLAARAKHAAAHGGLVLLVGDSTAGKTRSALHAVRRCMPEHRLYAPPRGAALSRLPGALRSSGVGRVVLWLDDLERFLGADGLDPALLGSLTALGVATVATLRDEVFETYRTLHAPGGLPHPDRELGHRVLRGADPVRVPRRWSPAELDRAAAAGEARLADAVAHAGAYGVAEYLAAGPSLLQSWEQASRVGGNPRGAALVRAAVDLARAGLRAAVDVEVLRDLHAGYLDDVALRPEGWPEALAWATEVRYGASGLLVPGEYPDTWRAFDYLPEALNRRGPDAPAVPEAVRDEVLELGADDEDRLLIGMSAYLAGATGHAVAAWLPLALAGDGSAAAHLAAVHEEAGEAEAAARWNRVAARDPFHSERIPLGSVESLYDPVSGTVALGDDRGGAESRVPLHRPGTGVCHGAVVGGPGVGKSNTLTVLLVGALASGRFVLWLLDWSAGQKHFRALLEADRADRYAGDRPSEALAVLRGAVRLIEHRRAGEHAAPAPTEPGVLVAVEDAHRLFGAVPEAVPLCLRILREGGPQGVGLLLTAPDLETASFGGSAELRREVLDDANWTLLMGSAALPMLRDAQRLGSAPRDDDPFA
ncbi:hypothetical protein ACIQBJ_29850 [Kitasatospora sp. NPDC088391]|uniref:hypothetical protein n=1 Tax=Kitasatospora sp. NPDC088391 TaxID=3364074 RepID=UPI00381BAEBD